MTRAAAAQMGGEVETSRCVSLRVHRPRTVLWARKLSPPMSRTRSDDFPKLESGSRRMSTPSTCSRDGNFTDGSL
jgi:hypothetical protein